MARAYASIILNAPVENVWGQVRDFSVLPSWPTSFQHTEIEGGLDVDVVGCVRVTKLDDGRHTRERLLALDDANHCLSYNFEEPPFPVKNFIATLRLYPVTDTNLTFAEWSAGFDEAEEDTGKYERFVSQDLFAANLKILSDDITKSIPSKFRDDVRWKGGQPNKVWTSRAIKSPVNDVWAVMRDFAGMGDWHNEITKMHMLERQRSDKVSGIRDFYFGDGHLKEELLHLSDLERSFSYRITESEIPWMNYVSGARLWPVTANNTTFGVWTGDWDASPQDDLVLMPRTEQNVYQKAFQGVEALLKSRRTS